MALHPFWKSIRSVIWGLFGRVNTYMDAGRQVDYESFMDAAAETADVWFTPELVKDYQEGDLTYFPPNERAAVDRAVKEFRELTAEVPPGGQPTPEQIERGYTLIGTVNNILAPHFGEEPDLRKIADATRPVRWPEYVLWSDVRLGNDSAGDPAVWIWLILKDDVEIESPSVSAGDGRSS